MGENKTVFVRNLSFDSEEEELRAMLEESFGKVLFARMVVDKVTNHPKVRHSTDWHCQHLLAWICPQREPCLQIRIKPLKEVDSNETIDE